MTKGNIIDGDEGSAIEVFLERHVCAPESKGTMEPWTCPKCGQKWVLDWVKFQ